MDKVLIATVKVVAVLAGGATALAFAATFVKVALLVWAGDL